MLKILGDCEELLFMWVISIILEIKTNFKHIN